MNAEELATGIGGPAEDVFEVTPDDDNDLPQMARGLLMETAGTVALVTRAGSTVAPTLPAGYNPIQVKRVLATGTSVSGTIWALV
jgi:hypothetical protein